jgi:hypothetical protein
MGVAHAKAAGAAFDLRRAGSLYICPNDNLVNGQLSLLASECLQDGARSGSSQLRGGNAQGASDSSLERFLNDDLYRYNPISGAYTFLGAFMTPITLITAGSLHLTTIAANRLITMAVNRRFKNCPLT